MSDWFFIAPKERVEKKEGRGSGHWGHKGRPGKVGGSLPGEAGIKAKDKRGKGLTFDSARRKITQAFPRARIFKHREGTQGWMVPGAKVREVRAKVSEILGVARSSIPQTDKLRADIREEHRRHPGAKFGPGVSIVLSHKT